MPVDSYNGLSTHICHTCVLDKVEMIESKLKTFKQQALDSIDNISDPFTFR